MIRFLITFAVLLVSLYAQGLLLNDSYYSTALNAQRQVDIYFPEAYFEDESAVFPVIIYLHGFGGSQNSQEFIIETLINLIDDGTVDPMIIAKPDGSVNQLPGWNPITSMFANSELLGNHQDAVAIDLVEYLDTSYRTIPERNYRAVLGYSMGGESAMRMAFDHPDVFCAAASHSSPLDYRYVLSTLDDLLQETGGSAPYYFTPGNGMLSQMNFSRAAAFSPNVSSWPYQVDFILNPSGTINQMVWQKWKDFDPLNLATNLESQLTPRLYFDIGEQDELGFYPYNISFADSLDNLEIDYVFESYPGTHSSGILGRMPISITFIDSVFNQLEQSIIPGDVNNDEQLNILDIIMIVNAIVYGTTEELFNADANSDGSVDILDIVSLQQQIIYSD